MQTNVDVDLVLLVGIHLDRRAAAVSYFKAFQLSEPNVISCIRLDRGRAVGIAIEHV